MQNAQQFLTIFGNGMGLNNLSFDEHNTCTLTFDTFTVVFEYVEAKSLFYLCSLVPEIHPSSLTDDAETLRLYSFILEQNSFCKGTGGGTFGLEPAMNAITYTTLFPLHDIREDTLAYFNDVLAMHVNAVEAMQKALVALLQESVEQDSPRMMHMGIRI